MYDLQPFSKQAFLLAIQSALGTPASPLAADSVAILEGNWQPQADEAEVQVAAPWFDAADVSYGNYRSIVTGQFDLIGSATVGSAGPYASLLRVLGHSQTLVAATSATYLPQSGGFTYGTLHHYRGDTVFKSIPDVLGAITAITQEINGKTRATMSIIGPFSTPTTQSVPGGISIVDRTAPMITTATWQVEVGGVEVDCHLLNATVNSQAALHTGSEVQLGDIPGRTTSGEILVTLPGSGGVDFYALNADRTASNIQSIVDGGGVGEITEINYNNVRFGLPVETTVGATGKLGLRIPFRARQTASNNRAYTIAFR